METELKHQVKLGVVAPQRSVFGMGEKNKLGWLQRQEQQRRAERHMKPAQAIAFRTGCTKALKGSTLQPLQTRKERLADRGRTRRAFRRAEREILRAGKVVAAAVAVLAMALLPGCLTPASSKGYVRAVAIEGCAKLVCEDHDRYVQADPNLTPDQKASKLDTSRLLLDVIGEAKK